MYTDFQSPNVVHSAVKVLTCREVTTAAEGAKLDTDMLERGRKGFEALLTYSDLFHDNADNQIQLLAQSSVGPDSFVYHFKCFEPTRAELCSPQSTVHSPQSTARGRVTLFGLQIGEKPDALSF